MEQSTSDVTLTPRQSEFIRQMANGASGRQAAKAVGYQSSAAVTRLLSDENLRNALKQAAIEAGNTPEAIGNTLRDAREANRFELDRKGIVKDLGPDHPSRIKATDVLVKLMGGYPKPGDGLELHAQNVLVIRPDQGLATSDPFALASEETEGTYMPPMPESLSESHPTRSEFDYIS